MNLMKNLNTFRTIFILIIVSVGLYGCNDQPQVAEPDVPQRVEEIEEEFAEPTAAVSPEIAATETIVTEVTSEEAEPVPLETASDEQDDPQPVPAETEVPQQLEFEPAEDIDTFFDESYRRLLRRDPELITELGLVDVFGMDNRQLTDISDPYIRETQALERDTLAALRGYDREALTADQQLTYDIYEWYLADLVEAQEFMYNNYPVTHFIISVPAQMLNFFTDIHPITNRQDAEDYIIRLSQVGTKFDQLLQGLTLREEAGVLLPRFLYAWVFYDLQQMANNSPRNTPFYTTFSEKLDALNDLSELEKEDLLAAAEEEIGGVVLPAYQDLVGFLDDQSTRATNEDGVWKFPEGDAYYDYTLRHHTSTDLTADEIHQIGKQEIERIQAEMQERFAELGYPADESLPAMFNRVAGDGGSLSGNDVVAGYEAIIQEADQEMDAVFDLRPEADVIVIGGPTGGYYIGPAVDGSRPGAFYASVSNTQPKFSMASLAYHEAIPGHHFQIAIAQELDLPDLRRGVSATAYTEGWALYAERLAQEMGLYEGDPYGDLGRLQYEAWRAVRLVVDTGIHEQGWTYDEAVDYMVENTGLPRGRVEFEISRYITWPGQATAYMIGMLEILALRQEAQDRLGEQFDLKEFHNVILGSGGMPLVVLDRVVEDYIEEKLADS